eukprot:750806-Hanusia_phi.AAC.1
MNELNEGRGEGGGGREVGGRRGIGVKCRGRGRRRRGWGGGRRRGTGMNWRYEGEEREGKKRGWRGVGVKAEREGLSSINKRYRTARPTLVDRDADDN